MAGQGREAFAAYPKPGHGFNACLGSSGVTQEQVEFVEFEAVPVRPDSAALEWRGADYIVCGTQDEGLAQRFPEGVAFKAAQLGATADEAISRARQAMKAVALPLAAWQPRPAQEIREKGAARGAAAGGSSGALQAAGVRRDRTHLRGDPVDSQTSPDKVVSRPRTAMDHHESRGFSDVWELTTEEAARELVNAMHPLLVGLKMGKAQLESLDGLKRLAAALSVDGEQLTGAKARILLLGALRLLLGDHVLGEARASDPAGLVSQGLLNGLESINTLQLGSLAFKLPHEETARGATHQQALKLIFWGKVTIQQDLMTAVEGYNAQQLLLQRQREEAKASKEAMMGALRDAVAVRGFPKGGDSAGGRGGGRTDDGPPMIKAVMEYLAGYKAADGREICMRFNVHGYSLRRNPQLCDGKTCGRAHIQVPAHLLKAANGGVDRIWKGGDSQGEAVKK